MKTLFLMSQAREKWSVVPNVRSASMSSDGVECTLFNEFLRETQQS